MLVLIFTFYCKSLQGGVDSWPLERASCYHSHSHPDKEGERGRLEHLQRLPSLPPAPEWADRSAGGPCIWLEGEGLHLLSGACPGAEQTAPQMHCQEKRLAKLGSWSGCSSASRGCCLRPLGAPGRGCAAQLTSRPAHSAVHPSSPCSRFLFAFFCSGISFFLWFHTRVLTPGVFYAFLFVII